MDDVVELMFVTEEIREPENDLSSFLAKQWLSDVSEVTVVAQDDGDDIDHELAHIYLIVSHLRRHRRGAYRQSSRTQNWRKWVAKMPLQMQIEI